MNLPVDESNGDQVSNIDVQTSYKKFEESQVEAEGKIVHDVSSEENKFSTSPHACLNIVNSSTNKRWKEWEWRKMTLLRCSKRH